MSVYTRLEKLGITLPPPVVPVAAFVMAATAGDLLILSGHIARREGQPWVGQLGRNMSTSEGREAARGIAVDLVATLHAQLGDLARVRRIVKLLCLVNSTADFTEQHLVTNGCSELLIELFAERGRHARTSFGVAQLPLGACVEIELIAEIAH
jgi:enamine deaminase RidA (YjgF/YER057c/UK114 family)